MLVLLAPLACADAWPDRVVEFAPGLVACLDGDPAAFVEAAWPIEQGRVGARVRRGAAAEYCVAALPGTVLLREPLPAAPLADPAAAAFFLERRCVDARRIEAADGRILGWLAYPACG